MLPLQNEFGAPLLAKMYRGVGVGLGKIGKFLAQMVAAGRRSTAKKLGKLGPIKVS